MSQLNLPEPANWAKGGKQALWAGLIVSVGMAYFVVRGILAGLRGNYLTTVLILGFIAFPVLMMIALLLAAAGGTQPRTSRDATGFTVLPDKRFNALYLTGLAVTGPSALLLAVFIVRGSIDIPMSRGLQIFSPFLFLAVAVFAVLGLISWVRRGGVGYIRFTPGNGMTSSTSRISRIPRAAGEPADRRCCAYATAARTSSVASIYTFPAVWPCIGWCAITGDIRRIVWNWWIRGSMSGSAVDDSISGSAGILVPRMGLRSSSLIREDQLAAHHPVDLPSHTGANATSHRTLDL